MTTTDQDEPTPEPTPEPKPEVEPVVHPGGAILAADGAPPPVNVDELAQRLSALESRVATLEQHGSATRRKTD